MDPASIVRHDQFVTTVGGAVYAQRGIVFPSRYHTTASVSFADVFVSKARAQNFIELCACPLALFVTSLTLCGRAFSRLGVPPDVWTAIALRLFGGGSYTDSGETPFVRQRSNKAFLMP